jgi:tripartite-type tricarboxylate transporter receptor subunit TctC
VVVDNRPGAGGTIAVNVLQGAPADGHTLMMLVIPTINFYHFGNKKIDYRKDLEPIAEIYDQYNVLVINPAVPEVADVQTLPQLIAKAKAASNGLNYASTGVGSLGHLTMERIASITGARLQHISYKGSAPAMSDLLGGQIGVSYADSQTALPHIRSGKLRVIAVSSAARQADLPTTPTMAEQGLDGLVAVPWGGIAAPPATPKVLVDRISSEIKAVLESPEVRDKMRQAGVMPAYKPAAEFREFVINESAVWGKVISERHIKPE